MSLQQLQLLPASGPVALTYNGHDILFDDAKMISLTDMWKAADSPANQSPYEWGRKEGSGFVDDLAKNLNTARSRIWKSRRGKHLGGTWAHWQIALAYAKYLSHDFHRFVNEAFKEWVQEKVNPSLKVERAIDEYRRRSHKDEWIRNRIRGIAQRKSFASTFADHNCKIGGKKENPYAEATRIVTMAATGKTPRELKAEKGLPKHAVTRDHLSKYELVRLEFIESEAERLIKDRACDGNYECIEATRLVAHAVRQGLNLMSA